MMCGRMTSFGLLLALFLFLAGHPSPSEAKLNLFLSQREVRRLLGTFLNASLVSLLSTTLTRRVDLFTVGKTLQLLLKEILKALS